MKVKKYQEPNGPIFEPRDNTNVVLRLPPENLTLQEAFPGARKVTPGFENHPVIKQGYRVFLSKNNDHRVGQESVFGERKYVAPWNQSIAQRLWNHVTDAMQLTSPPTYQDGYGRTLDAETPFWEGAQGKQLKQMGKSALNAATVAGLSFLPGAFVSNPWATTGAFGLGLGADFLAGKAMDGIENGVLRRSGLKFSDNQKTAVRLLAGLYGGAKGYKLGTRLSTPDVPIAHEPKVHQNDFINAPGNAEPIPLDKNAAIINQQMLEQLSSHNPSKLTREELMGLPKGERASYQASLGKSRITPEERMGIPKGDRNNGKYNGITFFRTLDQVPAINSDGFVDLTSPFNTFLNTTSDNLVHLHSMYPHLKNHAIAIDPEAFRGSTLTTLDPSDHVFIRETVKVKPKHVTLITGDPEAITLAQQRGFNVITNPKLKIYWQNGGDQTLRPDFMKMNSKGEWEMFSTHDFKKLYDEEVRKIVTNSFSRPKTNIYENLSKQTGLPLKTQSFTGKNFVKPYPGVEWSPSDFKHVVYNPASPAEQYLMTDYGLNVITDTGFIPLWKTSDSFGDRAQWIRIRKALDQMKQDVKPLRKGGKL